MTPELRHRLRIGVREFAHLCALVMLVAVVCGTAEVALLGWRRLVEGRIVGWHRFIPWMVPVGYFLVLLPVAFGGALATVLKPRWTVRRVCLALAVSIAGAGALHLLTSGRLDPFAVFLLAAAIGGQIARWDAAAGSVSRLAWRVAPWGAVCAMVLAAATAAGDRLSERGADGGGSPVAGAPNILLVIWDTARYLPLPEWGYAEYPLPNLRRLAAEGVEFTNAWSVTSWTLPAHAAILTGRYPDQIRADWLYPLESGPTTLAEVLRVRGYRTGAFVANLTYTSREVGLGRGFAHFDDHDQSLRQVLLSTELVQWVRKGRGFGPMRIAPRKRGERVTDAFLDWVAPPGGRPFFAMLNYYDAHVPYVAPAEFLTRFNHGRRGPDRYVAALAFLDHELGRLLGGLQARGLLDNTIVVVTSDHGEQFLTTHGLGGHGNSLYRQALAVPLVIWHAGAVPTGTRVGAPVSLRDVPATVLDLAGLPDTVAMPGTSLRSQWSGEPGREPSPVWTVLTPAPNVPLTHRNATGTVRSVVQGRYHCIANPDGSIEAFEVEADPFEAKNLASSRPDLAGSCRGLVDSLAGASALPHGAGRAR